MYGRLLIESNPSGGHCLTEADLGVRRRFLNRRHDAFFLRHESIGPLDRLGACRDRDRRRGRRSLRDCRVRRLRFPRRLSPIVPCASVRHGSPETRRRNSNRIDGDEFYARRRQIEDFLQLQRRVGDRRRVWWQSRSCLRGR